MEFENVRPLSEVAKYITEKIEVDILNNTNYISTENMLVNMGGVDKASNLPSIKKVNKFQKEDILFSNIRTYFKKLWFASFDGGSSTDVLTIRKITDEIDNKYLYYFLSQEKFFEYTVVTSKGTKMPRGDKDAIMKFSITVPSINTQQKIVNILSAFDDKIELNNKMNKTLEDMAKVIFKSFFIDFEPFRNGEFEKSELGIIPKGWELKKIKEITNVVTGKTPPTKKAENYGKKYPFITIPDMHNQAYIIKTDRCLSEIGNEVQKNKLLSADSLMVSCIATVGLVALTIQDSHTNQQINSIVCDKKLLYFLYCLMSEKSEELKQLGGAGTATLNVNKTTFENIKIIMPPNNELKKFQEKTEILFEKIKINTIETEILKEKRDTLLPKLMSGEVRV